MIKTRNQHQGCHVGSVIISDLRLSHTKLVEVSTSLRWIIRPEAVLSTGRSGWDECRTAEANSASVLSPLIPTAADHFQGAGKL
jgi:hypothetical protein